MSVFLKSSSVKAFPCDCWSEGLIVTIEEGLEDEDGAPFIGLAFWKIDPKFELDKLTLKERIRYAFDIIRGKSLWADMVYLRSKTAKNLANHILYLLNKNKGLHKKDELKELERKE